MNKKIILTLLVSTLSILSFAQPFALSGTSYTQSFDGLAGGLPSGWRVDSLVNPNAGLGNNAIFRFNASPVNWTSTGRGFKNVASADGLNSASTTTDQNASTDRALAIRQVGSTGWDDHDTLVSAGFNIANTTGLNSFTLQFKIMSLHTGAKRYNTWKVQYGIGATPSTFTSVTTTPTTLVLDSNFTSTSVSVNFGTALDNQSQPIWIRILPQDSTMGSGTRPLVGLDDFNLSWTGTAVNNTPQVTGYTPAPGATNVPIATTDLLINFDKNITIGTGNVSVKNVTDNSTQTIAASACTASGMNVTIPGVTLLTGKSYAVQYDSTCFKWTTYNCQGVYNLTSWTFSTTPAILPPVTSLNETFTGCTTANLGLFTQTSITGTQTWRCSNFGHTDSNSVYVNGGTAAESFENEDWLISPKLNLSAMTTPYLHFWTKRRFAGNTGKELNISSNFNGDVTAASWDSLMVMPLLALDSNNWNQFKNINLTTFKASPFTLGFRYLSTASTPSVAQEWTIDDVLITDGPLSVSTVSFSNIDMYIISKPNNDETEVVIASEKQTTLQLTVRDMLGNIVSTNRVAVQSGKNKFTLPTTALSKGMYFVTASNNESKGVLKFIK